MEEKDVKTRWLYVLKLKQGKYYVGITSQKYPYVRIDQHKNGFYSAQWVKKYGYDSVLEIQNLGKISSDETKRMEKRVTLGLMEKYGKDNVRGGDLNYSGKYIYRFGRFFRAEDWIGITVVVFLLATILYLILDKYSLT